MFRPPGSPPVPPSPRTPRSCWTAARAAQRRAGRLCDGWIASSKATPAAIRDAIAVVRDSAEQAGRDPAALRFVCRAPVRLRPRPAPDQPLFTGTADKIRADLAGLADTGLTEIFVDPNFAPGIGSPDAPADEAARRRGGEAARRRGGEASRPAAP
ncbi:LLM class flavin-dependent oxidoreductase [Streptomyces caniferus]|uniref:LLM class flavin-dependent oxidoreductase n=1 Tax=Streptomyces caniferus TaxID=285557 RepID=UPI003411971A